MKAEPFNSENAKNIDHNRTKTILIILVTIFITALLTFWITQKYFFPSTLKPVELTTKETQQLDEKIRLLTGSHKTHDGLSAEKYTEENTSRLIRFSERELNALLAKNTDQADRLAINLSDNLASAKLLVPLNEEFPILGGKTLELTGGLNVKFIDGRPSLIVKGISLWGIPIPNAWLGGIKNMDLVEQFGNEDGFWQNFSEGVDDFTIEEGHLTIKLRE